VHIQRPLDLQPFVLSLVFTSSVLSLPLRFSLRDLALSLPLSQPLETGCFDVVEVSARPTGFSASPAFNVAILNASLCPLGANIRPLGIARAAFVVAVHYYYYYYYYYYY
jgi:hypothetical protein